MRLFLLLGVGLSLLLCGCASEEEIGDETPQQRQAKTEVSNAIENSFEGVNEVELFSIDPSYDVRKDKSVSNSLPSLGGYKVIGYSALRDKDSINDLARSLGEGIRNTNGAIAMCFAPRHALRFKKDGSEITLIICFQCRNASAEGIKNIVWFHTTNSPEPVFDAIFKRAGLPKAP
jgi:hypothetical protein